MLMKKKIGFKTLFRLVADVSGIRSGRGMGLKGICLTLALASIPVGSASAAWLTTGKTVGGVEVEVRRPGNGVYPLVIFSHGMGGCPGNTDEIQNRLADKGYIVVAPKHRDCFSGDTTPDTPWGEPENWTDQSNIDRRDDIHAVLDDLPYSIFAQYITDFSSIGCMGHSMGGYTCMGLAGAWASWTRHEIVALAALSPWHKPFTVQNRVGDMVNSQSLYQGGTRDVGITPELIDVNGTFDQTSPAKYLQVFDRAGHSAWTDGILNDRFHEEMSYYINSFFDAALQGGNKKKLTQRKDRVSTLDYDHK